MAPAPFAGTLPTTLTFSPMCSSWVKITGSLTFFPATPSPTLMTGHPNRMVSLPMSTAPVHHGVASTAGPPSPAWSASTTPRAQRPCRARFPAAATASHSAVARSDRSSSTGIPLAGLRLFRLMFQLALTATLSTTAPTPSLSVVVLSPSPWAPTMP